MHLTYSWNTCTHFAPDWADTHLLLLASSPRLEKERQWGTLSKFSAEADCGLLPDGYIGLEETATLMLYRRGHLQRKR